MRKEREGGRDSQAPPTTVQPGLGVAGGVDPHPIELRFWVLGVDGDEGEEEEEEGGDLRTTHFWSCVWWMRFGVREGRGGVAREGRVEGGGVHVCPVRRPPRTEEARQRVVSIIVGRIHSRQTLHSNKEQAEVQACSERTRR